MCVILTSILSRPFSSGSIVACAISLVNVSKLGHKRIIGVGIGEQRANRQQNFKSVEEIEKKKTLLPKRYSLTYAMVYFGSPLTLGDCQCRRPLIFEDIQANAAIAVDVGMIDFGGEIDLCVCD